MDASKKYKALFFDLDRTLWDYRANSELTLKELLNRYAPVLNTRFEEFLHKYYEINDALWIEYKQGRISKKLLSLKRFVDTFDFFEVNASEFIESFSKDYIFEGPQKTKLFPNSIELLSYLRQKGYRMYLVTNGFLEVQRIKIRASGLEPYFQKMITSEEVGAQKPDERIFRKTMQFAQVEKSECIMIGDEIDSDVKGALSFGIDCIYVNYQKRSHSESPTYEINSLKELFEIL